ncbi:MAG: rRNA adenine N-6-methyltransferase family protein [Coriobacteriaceae bacterium]
MVAIDSYAGGDGRLSPLSTPSATRAVLEAHGIGTKYTLGQNFLVNDDVLKKIVALAEVGENDRILEVGPGIGTLTIALLKHAASVIAIERDPDLPAVLADTLHPWREKFALIEKDALDVTRDDIVSVASTMVEPGGDAGCLDRASSAANETAQWAVSQSEDCLSESGYPPAPPQETSNQIPEEDPHPEFAHIRLLMGAESYYLYDDSAMTDAYARWAFLAAEDDPVATFIECVREESSVYPRPMARENLANDPFRMNAEAVEAAFAEARAQGRADDIERVEASNGDVYFYSTTYLTPRRAQALAEWDAVERIRNV